MRLHGRAILGGACAAALLVAGPATALAPAPGADEPNVSALTATPLEPRLSDGGVISSPADADWFTVQATSESWTPFFGPRRRLYVAAERLQAGCADRSLRVTAYTGDGERVQTAAVPVPSGAEVGVLDLPAADATTRYDMVVDAALDPTCAQPIAYALRVYPVVPTPTTVSGTNIIRRDTSGCAGYKAAARGKKAKLDAARKATKKPSRRRLAKLAADARTADRRVSVNCPKKG